MICVNNLQIPPNHTEYSFSVAQGEILGIVGSPGSGKTTMLHLLSGHKKPHKGNIKTGGKLGFLFEDAFTYPRLTAGEHIKFFSSLHSFSEKKLQKLKNDLLLSDIWTARPSALTDSDLKRLNLAIILMSQPHIIFLDEPFFGVDRTSIFAMKEVLQAFVESGHCIVLSTFGQDATIRFCDRILYIETGLMDEKTAPAPTLTHAETSNNRIAVSKNGAIVLLRPEEILFVQASEGSAFVTTSNDIYDARCTLTMMEEKLSQKKFFRSHRSALVNFDDIQSIIPFSKNAFELCMRSTDQRVPLSKHRVDELKELLHL